METVSDTISHAIEQLTEEPYRISKFCHYIILNSTTQDLGLSINTQQTDNVIYPSPGMVLQLLY